jgi:S1-C subfamily serine protease
MATTTLKPRPRPRLAVAVVTAAVVAAALGVTGAHAASPPVGAAQGVVDITSQLPQLGGEAAGTGMLLGSSGEVLTNNHVIRDGTHIRVIVPGGRRYPVRVLGTNARKDVALLQIKGTPPPVAPVTLGDSSSAAVGAPVWAVGNAGGVGGAPSIAAGSITGLGRSITAVDDIGANPERLNGMIRVNAHIRPGDSGGPLVDAAGQVIGMDTAASSGSRGRGVTGFAIPINRARRIVAQIEAGRESGGVHIGPTAFLGVALMSNPVGGAMVDTVMPGSPAAAAGLAPGDLITSLAGGAVRSAAGLHRRLERLHPGDTVAVRWLDPLGMTHAAIVRLGSGPPA